MLAGQPRQRATSYGEGSRVAGSKLWRLGANPIYVYEGDRPVATFHREEDAMVCVAARNAVVDRIVTDNGEERA